MGIKGENLLLNILTIEEYINRKVERESDEKIAVDLFVSEHTLERWKTKVGVKRYHVNQKRYSIIVDMLEEGKEMSQIADRLRMTERQCRNIQKQFSETA